MARRHVQRVGAHRAGEAYSDFEANAYNSTATARTVTLEVLVPGGEDWTAFGGVVEAGRHLDFGTVSTREGAYQIRFRLDNGLSGNAATDFGHDTGPGGVTVFISADDDAGLEFWYH